MTLRLWLTSALILAGSSYAAGSAYAALTAPGPLPAQAQTRFVPEPVPVRISETPAPEITAPGALIVDLETMTTLYAKDAQTPRPIASLTKLATVMSVLDHRRPDEVLTIPALPTYNLADERMGLVPGEKLSVRDLVRASLIPSANDAADALAIADAGSQKAFIDKMNAKMRKWGIGEVKFASTSGLVDEGNTASPAALAKLAKLALANPTIAETTKVQSLMINDTAGRAFELRTTNRLLADPRFSGIKTGYTPAAGQCFIGLAEVNGRRVITVILGSQDRFGETQRLVDWVQSSYTWPQ